MGEGGFERRMNPVFDNQPESEAGNEEASDYLSDERIAQIRREVTDDSSWDGEIYEYPTEHGSVSLYKKAFLLDEVKPHLLEKAKERWIGLHKQRLEGEELPHEFILVRALHEQRNIEDDFDLPDGTLLSSLKVNSFDHPKRMLMNNTYEVFSATLAEHKKALEIEGVDEKEMAIDVAGHILHEQMHDPDSDALNKDLLRNGDSIGEFTPITTQLAYYLNRKFDGHGSYDAAGVRRGLKKIQAGGNDPLDHDIATAVGAELIRKHLREALPDAEAAEEAENMLEDCRALRGKFQEHQQAELIAALKNAIADSASQEKVGETIKALKERKDRNKAESEN